MLVLGIETSCDETAAAVVGSGGELLSSVVSTQLELHRPFGGVVPEIASRSHLENVLPVVDQAIQEAGVELSQIQGIGVTYGPGLVGALLVGLQAAKGLSLALNIPFVGVNHLEGHLFASFIPPANPSFPLVGMVVSGGHTSLFLVEAKGKYRRLGKTLDDAAGESFDKVAKMLGLGYPGGPAISKLATQGDPKAHRFPRAMAKRDNLDFSFSGLKTAVMMHLRKNPVQDDNTKQKADICASFQQAVVDVLKIKSIKAVKFTGCRHLVISGGVACNSRLREDLSIACQQEGIECVIPSPEFCTDNAAMIALCGQYYLSNNHLSPFDLNAIANLKLGAG